MKNIKIKRFRRSEMQKHKIGESGEKGHSSYVYLFFIMSLAVVFLFAGIGVVSAASPTLTSWSNTKTNNQDNFFKVNHGEAITFSVSANNAVKYEWHVNGEVQDGSESNSFIWTVPNEDGIWKIHVIAIGDAQAEYERQTRITELNDTVMRYCNEGGDPNSPSCLPSRNRTNERNMAVTRSEAQHEWVISTSLTEVSLGQSIQAAIDATPLTGGIVKLAAGTHNITDTIWITRDNLALVGAGMNETTIAKNASGIRNGIAIYRNGSGNDWDPYTEMGALGEINYYSWGTYLGDIPLRNITIGYFYLQGKGAAYHDREIGLAALAVENLVVSNVKTTGHAENGIWMSLGEHVTERDCLCSGECSALHSHPLIRSWMVDITILSGTCSKPAIELNTHASGLCSRNIIDGTVDGIMLYGTNNALVSDNIIDEASRIAFRIAPNTATEGEKSRNVVMRNIVMNSADGLTYGGSNRNDVIGNVLYGNNLGFSGGNSLGRFKNNIVVNNSVGVQNSGMQMSYNDVWGNGQDYSGCSPGTGDISVDPLFADIEGDDFHLKSTAGRWNGIAWVTDSIASPCIDKGDPSSDYSNEPQPNGGRINMGAYGNTAEASMSPGGATGMIAGTVKDTSNNPIQGATVSDGTRSAATNGAGSYTISNVPSGTYTVTVSKIGYQSAYQSGVAVNEGATTTVNFTLTPTPPDIIKPSTVTNLAASNPTSNSIKLTWTAPGDDGNIGTASQYDIRYSTSLIDTDAKFNSATQCTGEPAPKAAGSTETFTVTGLSPNTTYYFALKTADEVPNWSGVSNSPSGKTSAAVSNIVYVARDGTGDYNCDGIDDHIQINQAISYINSIGGGTVHLKAGTYIINDTINLVNNVIFEGESETLTIIKIKDQNNKANWSPFAGNSISTTTLQNFTLDGNKFNQTGLEINSDVDGFRIYNSNHVTVQYVTVQNFFTDSFEFQFSTDCTVHDSKAIQGGHDGLMIIKCQRMHLFNNYIYASGTGNTGVRIYQSSGCIVENNTFNVYGSGILINPQAGGTCGNNIYRYNYIKGNYYDMPAIAMHAWDTAIENETILGNIIAHSDYQGIRLYTSDEPGSKINNVKIINNVIYDSKSGIILEGRTDLISNITAKNNIIVKNHEYGIYGNVASSYNDIWNNTLGNYGGGASAGTGDISADPLFADTVNGDFHLKSQYGRWNGTSWVDDIVTSPGIDAGDPSSDYSEEPSPNGGRINMGAYGNTAEASKSPGGPLVDIFPPITTYIYSGVVTFFRSDIGSSGISYTNYSKISEAGPWTTVSIATATGPDAGNVADISEDKFNVSVTNEGTTTLWYYTVDNNNNVEAIKSVTIKIDTASPNITDVRATSITATSATITWNTDEEADTKVTYDTNSANLGNVWKNNSVMTKSHSILLSGLEDNMAYFFKVYSTDAAGNTAHSDVHNFTTLPVSPGTATLIINLPDDIKNNRLRESTPDTVISHFEAIDVGSINGKGYRDLIWFNLSMLNSTDKINSAKLSLLWNYEVPSRNKSTTVGIYRPDEWDTNYASWNNRLNGVTWHYAGGDWHDRNNVAQGDTPYDSIIFPGAMHPDFEYHDFDVTELVECYVNGTYKNTGFFIKADEVINNYISFDWDWNNASERPKLIISYTWGSSPAPENGAVSGTITYTNNGTGIADVTVNLSQGGSVIASTTTDSNGNYLITGLPPGAYTLTASKLRFWSNSSSVIVTAGEAITVQRALWLKGDLNNNGAAADDAGDIAMMMDASVGKITPDWRYDLNTNGDLADAGDQAMMKDASVGKIELV